MRKIIFGLCFLVSQIAWAGPVTPGGQVPSLTVGGRVFTDLTNLKVLRCFSLATNLCTFRAQGVAAGYQVTSGKTLTIWAIKYCSNNTTTGPFGLAQSDNDVGYGTASTALTNPIYDTGVSSLGTTMLASGTTCAETSMMFNVASQKYLSTVASTSGTNAVLYAYGYEQ